MAQIQRTLIEVFWSVVVIAAAWVATLLLYHFDRGLSQHGNFAFFLAAIAIAAWRGGLVAAVVTVVLASLAVAWLLPPLHSFHINDAEDVVRLALFIGLGVLISYLHHMRQRAERSLKESDRRLFHSLDSSGVACWDVNVKNGTLWTSHNLPEIFGRGPSDFAKTYEGFFAYIHPEDREFFHIATVGKDAVERDYQISHRIICGDGSIRRVSTRGRMYLGSDGRVERMVGAVFAVGSEPAAREPAAAEPAGVGRAVSTLAI
jgi:PAS domain-containing protein